MLLPPILHFNHPRFPPRLHPTIPILSLPHNMNCISQFHPSALLFLPVLPFFSPAYALGIFAGRYLATKEEEEGQAQFKGVFGGLGIGIGMGAAARGVIKTLIGCSRGRDLQSLLPDYVLRFGVRTAVGRLSVTAKHIGSVLDGGAGKTRKVLSAIGVVYFTA